MSKYYNVKIKKQCKTKIDPFRLLFIKNGLNLENFKNQPSTNLANSSETKLFSFLLRYNNRLAKFIFIFYYSLINRHVKKYLCYLISTYLLELVPWQLTTAKKRKFDDQGCGSLDN